MRHPVFPVLPADISPGKPPLRSNRHFDFACVRFFGGKTLNPKAGCGTDAHKQIVVLSGIADKFISNAYHKGQARKALSECEDRCDIDIENRHQNADEHHDKQKAGAAAWMESALNFHVFRR